MGVKGVCRKCGRETVIVNKTRCLCDSCNYKRLHNGLSRFEYKLVTGRKLCQTRRKNTGEAQLFKEIWAERPHVCAHCGRQLSDPMRAGYFSHIHSKGARPDLRLCKDNIELLCLECHSRHEFGFNYERDSR